MNALAFGARLVEASTDEDLAQAARQAFAKIEAISSTRRNRRVKPPHLFSGKPWLNKKDAEMLGSLRRAVDKNRYVDIEYVDLRDATSARRIRPLGLVFRVDRIQGLHPRLSCYDNDPNKSWDGFVAQLQLDIE